MGSSRLASTDYTVSRNQTVAHQVHGGDQYLVWLKHQISSSFKPPSPVLNIELSVVRASLFKQRKSSDIVTPAVTSKVDVYGTVINSCVVIIST